VRTARRAPVSSAEPSLNERLPVHSHRHRIERSQTGSLIYWQCIGRLYCSCWRVRSCELSWFSKTPSIWTVPEQQAQVLFLTTNRVVEAEFHAPGTLENTFRMRLVLGEKAERFTIDDPSGNGTIYLEKWNEGRFAVAAMRLAVQHLLGPDRQKRMLEEIGHHARRAGGSDLRRAGSGRQHRDSPSSEGVRTTERILRLRMAQQPVFSLFLPGFVKVDGPSRFSGRYTCRQGVVT